MSSDPETSHPCEVCPPRPPPPPDPPDGPDGTHAPLRCAHEIDEIGSKNDPPSPLEIDLDAELGVEEPEDDTPRTDTDEPEPAEPTAT
jgi:hypothetical protein